MVYYKEFILKLRITLAALCLALTLPTVNCQKKFETKSSLRVTHQHRSNVSGILHVYYQEQVDGIDLFGSVASSHFGSNGQLINRHDQTIKNWQLTNNVAWDEISIKAPINSALKNIMKDSYIEIDITDKQGLEKIKINNPYRSDQDIEVGPIYFANADGHLVQCIRVEILTDPDWWVIIIDAASGEIYHQYNQTLYCNIHGHSHEQQCTYPPSVQETEVMPMHTYKVIPLGTESPLHGPRMIVTDPADTNASPFGWHDINGEVGDEFTTTQGNNVDAKDDIINDNETTAGQRANGGANMVFDFPFDQNLTPVNSLNAALTNLFYWNNIIHDVLYYYGFDEASGNFQTNNYSNQGLENDQVLADAIDGSGTNNANFSTPSDGNKPRMQMFAWNITSGSNSLNVNAPSTVAGNLTSTGANFGPTTYNVTADVVLADPLDACATIVNGSILLGKIAIIDRGVCNFSEKVYRAQQQGAVGVIICQNSPAAPITMGNGTNGSLVTIPSRMLSQANCDNLKINIANLSISMMAVGGIQRDSDFDSGVLAHEYGHGVSNRLTGGASNTGCLGNSEQMGEGWSDYIGLMMTMKPTDDDSLARGVGNYLTTGNINGAGIRPFRYTVDMSVNPHTYSNINSVSVPHGVGSVWCAMLWEMTWALINEYGFDADYYQGQGGNNMALKLVLEGMKLQPCNPGFVDGRDAILLADEVLYGGKHQCLIWKAFAKRGLGYSASQGSSNSVTDGSQAFNISPSCFIDIQIKPVTAFGWPEDIIHYDIAVTNLTDSILPQAETSIYIDSTLTMWEANSPYSIANGIISFVPIDIDSLDTVHYVVSGVIPTDANARDTLMDDAEGLSPMVETTSVPSSPRWMIRDTLPYQGIKHWYAREESFNAVKYLTNAKVEILAPNAILRFWHKFDFEVGWDGGLVEISSDNKRTWVDLGPNFIQNGYQSFINDDSLSYAFSGDSEGYIQSSIDLSSWAYQHVYIRFKLYCDPSVREDGWYIDNISLSPLKQSFAIQGTVSNPLGYRDSTTVIPEGQIMECGEVYRDADGMALGTLRQAVDCATDVDTIYILPHLYNDTLFLLNTIAIDKQLLINNSTQTVTIHSNFDGTNFLINTDKSLHIKHLHLMRSNPTISPFIDNEGSLILEDSKTSKVGTGLDILNKGTLLYKGSTIHEKD